MFGFFVGELVIIDECLQNKVTRERVKLASLLNEL